MGNPLYDLHRAQTTTVYPIGPETLGSIWSDIVGVVTGGTNFKQVFQDQIDSATAKIEAKLGTFLTTNQTIRDLIGRAQAQQNNPNSQVGAQAQAVAGKGSALLTQFNNISSQSTSLIQKLVALKNQLATDPTLQTSNPLSMGSRIVQLFNTYKDTVSQTVSAVASLNSRIDQHMKDVDSLKSDVTGLEAFAQGKGFKATIQGIGGGIATNALKPIPIVGAIGLLVYFLGPSLFGRLRRS